MPAPSSFGHYELREMLARGGMAEVWLADWVAAAGGRRRVVLKRILPAYAEDPEFVKMFVAEARVAIGLSHGNIAQVLDFGEEGGQYFIAMEHVDGPSLDGLLAAGVRERVAIDPALAAFVAARICEGLHHAHTRLGEDGQPLGIVHRDVSPQNVVVSFEGQVKLVDFGIAQARVARDATRPGVLKGKVHYFSPEQAAGRRVDARTDVWATGVVLYEMLTHRLPFQGSLAEVMPAIGKGDFPPPSARAEVDAGLEAVVLRAMALDPAARYASSGEMRDALVLWLHANAPGTGEEALAEWTRFLSRDVLGARGLRVEVSKELQKSLRHRQARFASFGLAAGPAPPPSAPEPPRDPRAHTERAVALADDTAVRAGPIPVDAFPSHPNAALVEPTRVRAAPASLRPALVFAAGAALLVALAIPLGLSVDRGRVRVSSDPPGSEIVVDGKPSGLATTAPPGTDVELGPGRHVIALRHLGYAQEEWVVELDRLDRASWRSRSWHATLERPTNPRPPPRETVAAPLLPARGSPDAVAFLDVARGALTLPDDHLPKVRLDPAHRYRLTVAGQISNNHVGGVPAAHPLFRDAYFAAAGPGDRLRLGRVPAGRPVELAGASRLWVFALDWPAKFDNRGALSLTVTDLDSPRGAPTLRIDGREHALLPSAPVSVPQGTSTHRFRVVADDADPPDAETLPWVGYAIDAPWVRGDRELDPYFGLLPLGAVLALPERAVGVSFFPFHPHPDRARGKLAVLAVDGPPAARVAEVLPARAR